MTSFWNPHPAALVVAVEAAADAAAGLRIGRVRCDTHPCGSMLTFCCIRNTKIVSCLRELVRHTRSRVTSPAPLFPGRMGRWEMPTSWEPFEASRRIAVPYKVLLAGAVAIFFAGDSSPLTPQPSTLTHKP